MLFVLLLALDVRLSLTFAFPVWLTIAAVLSHTLSRLPTPEAPPFLGYPLQSGWYRTAPSRYVPHRLLSIPIAPRLFLPSPRPSRTTPALATSPRCRSGKQRPLFSSLLFFLRTHPFEGSVVSCRSGVYVCMYARASPVVAGRWLRFAFDCVIGAPFRFAMCRGFGLSMW